MSTTINWRRREEHGDFTDGETLFVQTSYCATLFDVITADIDGDGFVEWFANGEDPWRRDWEDVVWWVPIEEIEATLPEVKE